MLSLELFWANIRRKYRDVLDRWEELKRYSKDDLYEDSLYKLHIKNAYDSFAARKLYETFPRAQALQPAPVRLKKYKV